MSSLFHRYSKVAWMAAFVLVVGWLISIRGGTTYRDCFGQPLGPDFLAFYTAATLFHEGRSEGIYDFRTQVETQSRILHSPHDYLHHYLNPPLFGWALQPLAMLDYRVAFVLWTLAGLVILWGVGKMLGTGLRGSWLGWYPVFAVIAYGQNTFWSLGIVALCAWLWVDQRKSFVAGIVAGLLLYKPQLAVGIFIGFFILREWKVLMGMAVTGVMGGLFSWLLLKQETLDFIRFQTESLPLLMAAPGMPNSQFFDIRGFLKLLFPMAPPIVLTLGLIVSILVVGGSFKIWSEKIGRSNRAELISGVVLLVPWSAPFLLMYDWTLLLIPSVLLSRNEKYREFLAESAGLLWTAGLLSYPLSLWMSSQWGFAIQIAPIVLGWVTYRFFKQEQSHDL